MLRQHCKLFCNERIIAYLMVIHISNEILEFDNMIFV